MPFHSKHFPRFLQNYKLFISKMMRELHFYSLNTNVLQIKLFVISQFNFLAKSIYFRFYVLIDFCAVLNLQIMHWNIYFNFPAIVVTWKLKLILFDPVYDNWNYFKCFARIQPSIKFFMVSVIPLIRIFLNNSFSSGAHVNKFKHDLNQSLLLNTQYVNFTVRIPTLTVLSIFKHFKYVKMGILKIWISVFFMP